MAGKGSADAANKDRKLASWTDSFWEFSENLPSPPLFRKWAAISAIAGAMERKVWIKTSIGLQYPNCYILLVGPPGGGKTVLTSIIKKMWGELENHHIASDSISPASLRDEMREAERRVFIEGLNLIQFNSLKVGIDELGVLIPAYERELINQLTSWWDNQPFKERKRSKDLNYKVDAPQLNILGGCTPSFLRDTLPEGAWDQGFCSRSLFIFSSETFPKSLFEESVIDKKLYADLTHDLKIIGSQYGELTFAPDAAEALNTWHMAGGEPKMDHPKLQHYNTRRTVHVLKLMQIAHAARTNDTLLTIEDYRLAMDWLAEAEAYMPDIFKAMTSGGDSKVIEELYHFAYQIWIKENRPIIEARLMHWLAERVPSMTVHTVLKVVVGAGILVEEYDPKLGKCYKPAMRKKV